MLHLHVPKTGGSTVWSAFPKVRWRNCISMRRRALRGHLTYLETKKGLSQLGRSVDDYVIFAFVRDPWAWQLSWYTYIRATDPMKSGMPVEHELFRKFSFSDYLNWVVDEQSPFTSTRHEPNSIVKQRLLDWFVDETGGISVDAVLRTEHLNEDLAAFAKREGVLIQPLSSPRNVSNKQDYRSFYSDADAEMVRDWHGDLFQHFPYQFGDASRVSAVFPK